MSKEKHHIISLRTYLIVFLSLIVFTFITIASTYIELGSFNIVLALLIASFKSSLVLLFFMHLYYDNKINLAFIIASFLFLAIFIGLTMIDTTRRGDIDVKRNEILRPQIEYQKFYKGQCYETIYYGNSDKVTCLEKGNLWDSEKEICYLINYNDLKKDVCDKESIMEWDVNKNKDHH